MLAWKSNNLTTTSMTVGQEGCAVSDGTLQTRGTSRGIKEKGIVIDVCVFKTHNNFINLCCTEILGIASEANRKTVFDTCHVAIRS
jgi:hypothetical protein